MASLALAPENRVALLGLVVFGLVCAAAGILLMRRLPGPKEILRRWVEKQGFELQQAQRRWLRRGPFTLWFNIRFRKSVTTQSVYRITVRDLCARTRKGYVRIGGFWGLGDHVDVAWDREPGSDVDVPDVDDVL